MSGRAYCSTAPRRRVDWAGAIVLEIQVALERLLLCARLTSTEAARGFTQWGGGGTRVRGGGMSGGDRGMPSETCFCRFYEHTWPHERSAAARRVAGRTHADERDSAGVVILQGRLSRYCFDPGMISHILSYSGSNYSGPEQDYASVGDIASCPRPSPCWLTPGDVASLTSPSLARAQIGARRSFSPSLADRLARGEHAHLATVRVWC